MFTDPPNEERGAGPAGGQDAARREGRTEIRVEQHIGRNEGGRVVGVEIKDAKGDITIITPSLSFAGEDWEPLVPPEPGLLPEPGVLPPGSRLPIHRNAVFTGRERDLLALGDALLHATGRMVGFVQAAAGMGGIGKTELAVEFCWRYGRFFQGVHWIQADQDIAAEVAACGLAMGIRPWPAEQPDQVLAALAAWKRGGGRLVVLDNAESTDSLQDWLPKLENVRVLVTSRLAEWPPDLGITVHRLEVMGRMESLALLRKLAPRLEKESGDKERRMGLDEAAERLGDLPLALDLAGRYLQKRPRLTVLGYLKELDGAGNALAHTSLVDWTRHSPTKHETNLAAMFYLSWKRLKDETARQIFRLCGYCAPNVPIPWEIFLSDEDELEIQDQALDLAVGKLEDLGFVTVTDGGPRIHPLLAEFARMQDGEAPPGALKKLAENLGILSWRANETGLPEEFKPLRAHLQRVANFSEEAGVGDAATLWSNLGTHLRAVGEYDEAREAFERALAIDEQEFGSNDPIIAEDLNKLASVLQDLGDLASAKAGFELALVIDEQAYGPDHPNSGIDRNNLGLVLKELGDLAGAKAAIERALAIVEQAYGQDHPSFSADINNLGLVLQDMGDLDGAKAAFERSIEIGEKTLGHEHPTVATSINNLGAVLRDLGDLAGAKTAFERALAIDHDVFGLDHPNVARDIHNLGKVLIDLGDLPGAKIAFELAKEIWMLFLPDGHPYLQYAAKNLQAVEGALAAASTLSQGDP